VTSAKATEPGRRTQQQRREGTIRKLLDAATEVLIEDGYASASVQVICERAGVSQGALFRHFETREALMVAVGQNVGRQTLARYRREFDALGERDDRLMLAMRLVRDRCRSRLNQAWYELAMAARTSGSLKRGLRPVAEAYYADIDRLARELLPDLAAAMGERFAPLVETVIGVFDGEMVRRFVLAKPASERIRLEMLDAMASALVRKRP
jgi:AcrR family transcriptional regulator